MSGTEHFSETCFSGHRRPIYIRPLWVEAPVQVDDEHPLVHELVPTVPASDGRQADVLVRGMSIGGGLPVVGDMCMGSVLHLDGSPYRGADEEDGAPSTG